jgi:hypothetical protein
MTDEMSGGGPEAAGSTKTCPACAEKVQLAAQVCRFCGYDFNAGMRPGAVAAGATDTNGKAIASLVLGILWMFGLGSLLAVILGHMAKREIDRTGGRQGGRGLAIAGLILGWLGVAGIIAFVIVTAGLFAVTSNAVDKEATAEMEIALKNAATAQESFATGSGGQYTDDLNDLYLEGLVPQAATLTIVEASSDGYCMEAELEGETMYISSDSLIPEDGTC